MLSLNTSYVGLSLKNPLIVSSSGLTNTADKVAKLAESGAGAVVLKSLFEEQITYETGHLLGDSDYPEALDYVKTYAKSHSLDEYLKLIENSVKKTDIPVIASINCVSVSEWVDFAAELEKAGAHALELNIYIVPTNVGVSSDTYEQQYYSIIREVKKFVKIPVIVKIGSHFTNILRTVDLLAASGASGVVLFNRFYQPDIDIDDIKFTSSEVFSTPSDIRHSLRWVGMVAGTYDHIDVSASTGIHDGHAVAKQLLAGATSVQACSAIYKNGPEYITTMLQQLSEWMERSNYETIADFRGKMSYARVKNPAMYERSQFMRYFSSIE